MNNFWTSFWSNFLANIAVVVALSIAGYIAKGSIAKNLKKFIDKEIVSALFVIQKAEEKSHIETRIKKAPEKTEA